MFLHTLWKYKKKAPKNYAPCDTSVLSWFFLLSKTASSSSSSHSHLLQSPPKGATIPYRPKPAMPPVLLSGGQAFSVTGQQLVIPQSHPNADVSLSTLSCFNTASFRAASYAFTFAVYFPPDRDSHHILCEIIGGIFMLLEPNLTFIVMRISFRAFVSVCLCTLVSLRQDTWFHWLPSAVCLHLAILTNFKLLHTFWLLWLDVSLWWCSPQNRHGSHPKLYAPWFTPPAQFMLPSSQCLYYLSHCPPLTRENKILLKCAHQYREYEPKLFPHVVIQNILKDD